jgi:prepilin-type N-terminal cleavage/methylation domain-containing protein
LIHPQRRGDRGFTLIELLAVVAMFALLAGMVAPLLHLGGSRAARREAEDLAGAVEFARQRAVMTGRTHRLVMDLDRGQHRIEWLPPPEPEAAAGERSTRRERKIAMTPPDTGLDHFVPAPGALGRDHEMDSATRLLEVRLPGDSFARGVVVLAITPDGAADPALIRVGSAEGEPLYDVRVEALADAAEISDAR